MKKTSLDRTVAIASALRNRARLRTVAMLATGELCACQIVAILGLANSTVSAHLAVLRRAGLVDERKQGRWVVFRLADEQPAGVDVRAIVAELERDPQIASDRAILSRLRKVPLKRLCEANLDLAELGIAERMEPAPLPGGLAAEEEQ